MYDLVRFMFKEKGGREGGRSAATAWRLELERVIVKGESSFRRLVSGGRTRNNGVLAARGDF